MDELCKPIPMGLDNCPIKTDWIIRMDADEFISQKLTSEISSKISGLNKDISGIFIKRRVHFMGRWIKHGDYPIWLLRIWNTKEEK